jgi:uncharacterized protein YbaP (TraB family)
LLVVLTPGEAAAEPPLCRGKDLVAELAKTNGAVAATVKAAGDAVANARAILWRIERDGTAPSHLFGTMHSTDPRVTAMPEPARAALAQARAVAIEATGADVQAMLGPTQGRRDLFAMPPGEGLSHHLGAREVERLDRAARERGASAAALDQIQPWLVALMLAEPPCERARLGFGLEMLDARIEAAGRQQGADVVSLEAIDEMLARFTSMPLELQLVQLKAMLTIDAEAEDYHETLVRLYLERRLGETWPLMLALSEDKQIARRLVDDFQRRLLDERNLVMRDRALPLIEKGGAFIAVGALHLSGDTGLVALLRLTGYKVTPVD